MENKPQNVQFGKQPPTDDANVSFGKHAETAGVETHTPGDEAPTHDDETEPATETKTGGIVPEFAGGDPVPDDAASDADDAESGTDDDAAADDDDDDAESATERR
jgi:hypothetical protein